MAGCLEDRRLSGIRSFAWDLRGLRSFSWELSLQKPFQAMSRMLLDVLRGIGASHRHPGCEGLRHSSQGVSSTKVRIVNLDRNDGNLLVAIESRRPCCPSKALRKLVRPRLIPIDHGLSLPDRLEVMIVT